MRIERLALRGFLRFRDEVSLDLTDVPAGLVAIVGENGSGKTTLLEAALAAIYREFPSRGKELFEYATDRDSFLDLQLAIDGRGVYRARVNVDGVRRGADAVLETIQPDGRRVPLNDGKVTTFDQVIAREFPSKAQLLASAFAAQNKSGSFISLDKKARKQLFMELLAIDHYEAMSSTARQAAMLVEQASSRLDALRSVLAGETADGILAELDRQAGVLQVRGGQAEADRADLKITIARLEAALALVADQAAAYAAAKDRVSTIEAELGRRRGDRAKVDANRRTSEQGAAADRRRIDQELETAQRDIANRIAKNKGLQAQADSIRAAVVATRRLEATIADLRTELERQNGAVDLVVREDADVAKREAVAVAATADLTRARADAALLGTVPCHGVEAYVGCQFLKNASAAQGRIAAVEVAAAPLGELQAARQALRTRYQEAQDAANRTRTAIRTAETDKASHAAAAQLAENLAAAEARIAELQQKRQDVEASAARQRVAVTTRLTEYLAQLDTEAATLDAAIARLEADLQAAQRALEETAAGNQQAAALHVDLAAARQRWDGLTAAVATVVAGQRELQRRREEIAAKRRQLVDVGRRIAQLHAELLDWQLLAKAFSRDGLPVLEIDAAGPTISAYTNDLLTSCFGPRFSVELVTQRAKADGKGMVDEFTIKVTDNARGAEPGDIADLSGGEQAIVNEALMNGIALFVNSRSPLPIRTAWRDETTGALDPENAIRYVEMLRKVQQLGGFHHVLFITHNPDAAALADAQIHVAGGRVELQQPPYVVTEAA